MEERRGRRHQRTSPPPWKIRSELAYRFSSIDAVERAMQRSIHAIAEELHRPVRKSYHGTTGVVAARSEVAGEVGNYIRDNGIGSGVPVG